ncbi:hypothetical protein [uncultured Veillonella sp.]|uniref:hypothetical protein n=1 Tax=uncultured Veillonella sp. TaxID=159268 RepID=UPI0025D9BC68|nr:hypothetical protein [uncultured Veillonella sp.]
MKSLINVEYLKNIYNCIGKNVNNVFVLRDNSFDESEIEYISDGCIYLQFENQIIKFINKSILGPDLDDYPNLGFEEYENLNDNYLLSEFSLYALNITGIINDIKIVNDEFSSWWDNDIICVDIALKFNISGAIYYLILWDSIPDTISWIDGSNITSENYYKLRDRISNFWIGKSPDFKYFYRKEISIHDRLNNL